MPSPITASAWDAFVESHPHGHILQTSAWADLKCAFGWSAARVDVRENGQLVAGAQILFRPLPFGLASIAYIPKGPLVDWRNPSLVNYLFASIDNVARSGRAIFLKIEPDEAPVNRLAELGFQLSPHPIQPRRTLVVDLRPDEEAILAAMKQKTRYNIRLAARKDVLVAPRDDVGTFIQLMQVTGERDKFGVHSGAYYRKAYELFRPSGHAQLFLAAFNGQPLAGLMLFVLGGRAWYFYGGSSDVERSRMPAYLLQWEAMHWAKARGATSYDLWGVPDEDEATLEASFETRHDGLWGVYRFKRGFGGALKRAAQAMDRVYNPLLYWAYLKFIGNRE